MSRAKLEAGERRFVISLTIREDRESEVTAHEIDENGETGRSSMRVPKGEFGVREGLRIGGNVVREMYRNKQRELILKSRAETVKQRRSDRVAARVSQEIARRTAETPAPPPPASQDSAEEFARDQHGQTGTDLAAASEGPSGRLKRGARSTATQS